jgi:hypothetical protein
MVDQHGLLAKPLRPAILTDLLDDTLANRARKRRTLESRLDLPASNAGNLRHRGVGWSLRNLGARGDCWRAAGGGGWAKNARNKKGRLVATPSRFTEMRGVDQCPRA